MGERISTVFSRVCRVSSFSAGGHPFAQHQGIVRQLPQADAFTEQVTHDVLQYIHPVEGVRRYGYRSFASFQQHPVAGTGWLSGVSGRKPAAACLLPGYTCTKAGSAVLLQFLLK